MKRRLRRGLFGDDLEDVDLPRYSGRSITAPASMAFAHALKSTRRLGHDMVYCTLSSSGCQHNPVAILVIARNSEIVDVKLRLTPPLLL